MKDVVMSFANYPQIKKIARSAESAVARFEQMQNALMWADSDRVKGGELDLNRLSEFSTTDDIFTIEDLFREGRNHAVLIAADFSSSMGVIGGPMLRNLMTKLVFTYLFCRDLNIPIRIYGIGLKALSCRPWDAEIPRIIIDERGFGDKEAEEFLFEMFMFMALGIRSEKYRFGLGGTPGHETMIELAQDSYDILANPNIENKNVIIMTDGVWYSDDKSDFTFLLKDGNTINMVGGQYPNPAEAWSTYLKTQFPNVKFLYNYYYSVRHLNSGGSPESYMKRLDKNHEVRAKFMNYDPRKSKSFFDEETLTAFYIDESNDESNIDRIMSTYCNDSPSASEVLEHIPDHLKKKMCGEYAEFLLAGVTAEGRPLVKAS